MRVKIMNRNNTNRGITTQNLKLGLGRFFQKDCLRESVLSGIIGRILSEIPISKTGY